MPVQKSQSSLVARFGGRLDNAVKQHARDETDYGFVRLPGGITNGVARFTTFSVGEFKEGNNKGQPFVRLAGTVVEPETVETPQGVVKVRGLQTSALVPICATKGADGKVTPVEDQVAALANHLRMLGGPDATAACGSVGDLEALGNYLANEAKPYFRFATRESAAVNNPDGTQKYAARVWESWHGTKGLEDYVPPDARGKAFQDGATPAPNANGTTHTPVNRVATKEVAVNSPKGAAAVAQTFNEFQEGEPSHDTDEPDLDELASLAAQDDGNAQAALREKAVAAGYDAKVVDDAESWEQVVAMIREGTTEAPAQEEEEQEPEPPPEPAKGELYNYQPPGKNPKTKAPWKKVEVEVTAVSKKNRTVDLLNNTDKKTVYKAVPWDALLGE